MKTIAGLWIDHRKAVIVIASAKGEETTEICSNVEKQPGRYEGVRSVVPYDAQQVKADDIQQRVFSEHLNHYYERVLDAVRDAEAILIFGPGEAKGEFRKHLNHAKVRGTVLDMETTDKMTDGQIAARVREYFQK